MYFDEEVYNYFEDIKIEIKNETNKKVATHLKFYDNLSSIPKYKDLSYYEDSVKEFSKEIKKKVVVVKVSHTTQPCSSSNMKKREDIGEGYYEDESGNILHDLVHRPKKEEPISLSQMKERSTFYKEIKEIVEKVLEENRVQSKGRKRRKAPYVKIRDEILMEENRWEIIEEWLNRDKPCEEPEIHELNGLPINHCDYFIARGWLRDYIDLMKSYLYADCDVIRVKKHIEKSTKKLNKINKKILKDIKKKEKRETKEHNRNVWKA